MLRNAPMLAALIGTAASVAGAEPPIALGSRRELFVDRILIDTLNGATLELHEPVSAGTAIRIDKPWEGPANFGGSVLQHGGRYLLYYRAVAVATGSETGGVCVAVRNSSRKYFIAAGYGVAAASPSAQNDRPAICPQRSAIVSSSPSAPEPCSNFSSRPVIQ